MLRGIESIESSEQASYIYNIYNIYNTREAGIQASERVMADAFAYLPEWRVLLYMACGYCLRPECGA